MCGIAGVASKSGKPVPGLDAALAAMNRLQAHRGPDGEGIWTSPSRAAGLGHRRLSIIDLETGQQPMSHPAGLWISYNGEIYNFLELRDELGPDKFRTQSDTEVILHAYRKWGPDGLSRLRGMFAFALWDEGERTLFCARDRMGMKPLFYAETEDRIYVASEAKALLPFLPSIETDQEGVKDYLTFQFCLGGKTLFRWIRALPPGSHLTLRDGRVVEKRFWLGRSSPDFDRTERYFEHELRSRIRDAVRLHLRSDVPAGTYLSGGMDSSGIASIATSFHTGSLMAFSGRFDEGRLYDESPFARDVASAGGMDLRTVAITPEDFSGSFHRILYHMDYPVAGPGVFPQYVVSKLAAEHRKVVLGGQGGDELFGGYARYLIAYFEQCIKGAIDGTLDSGNFVVTYQSILPNLRVLEQYKPMIQDFWREGLFDDMDRRYFRLINRAPHLDGYVDWRALGDYSPYETFRSLFESETPWHRSYLEKMVDFDLVTLLPALLHVEDRISMAHGLESRVPLLDPSVVDLALTIPSDVKFKGGELKHILRQALRPVLPASVLNRKDKMGFPVPLHEWTRPGAPLYAFFQDLLGSAAAKSREIIDNRKVAESIASEPKFGRQLWGFACLEAWQQVFHDHAASFKKKLNEVQS